MQQAFDNRVRAGVPTDLTIVVPAYKPTFLRATLHSLAEQTDADFDVVVGDDAGPPEIAALCKAYAPRLRLRYHRFDHNLGGSDLPRQWQRCVDLAHTTWAMLLGDDDQLDAGCVHAFRQALVANAGDPGDVWRFDTRQVDAQGALLRENPPHAELVSSEGFIDDRFRGRPGYLNEYVFRIAALRDVGGFVSFPLGWCSDDATWVLLGARSGIRRIPGAKVSWRLSGANISSAQAATASRKLSLQLDFYDWLDGWDARHGKLTLATRARAADLFCARYVDSGALLSPWQTWRAARRLDRFARIGLATTLRRLLWSAREVRRRRRTAPATVSTPA